jgi:hypothetical protein
MTFLLDWQRKPFRYSLPSAEVILFQAAQKDLRGEAREESTS